MADDKELSKLNASAQKIIAEYKDAFNIFLDALEGCCNTSIIQVIEKRIEQAFFEIDEMKKTIESNSGYGINLIDLIFTFIPIAGGHLFEKVVTSFFKNKIASRYSNSKQFTSLLKDKSVVEGEMLKIDKTHPSYGFWQLELQRVNLIIDNTYGKFREKEEFLNNLLEFSMPIMNDYFQQLGQEMFNKTKHKSLEIFEDLDPSSLKRIEDYNRRMISDHKSSPCALIRSFLENAIEKEKENLKYEIAFVNFCLEVNANEEYAKEIESLYRGKIKSVPDSSKLDNFKGYFKEVLEAMIWFLIFGHPRNWARTYNSDYDFYKRRLVDEDGVSSYEFFLKINIPKNIYEHMLSRFHPFPEHENIEIATINYLDYYKIRKKNDLSSSSPELGISERRAFLGTPMSASPKSWDVSRDGPPANGRVKSTTSQYYTAEETAFANLQADFANRYFEKAASLASYFNSIVSKHKV